MTRERSFGLSVGGVLILLAAFFAWRGAMGRAEIAGPIGAVLMLLAVVYPPLLTWPAAGWWRLAHALGYVNARIILTVLFAVILAPLGLMWRLTGHDPLGRRREKWGGWTPYPARYRDRRHYARMF